MTVRACPLFGRHIPDCGAGCLGSFLLRFQNTSDGPAAQLGADVLHVHDQMRGVRVSREVPGLRFSVVRRSNPVSAFIRMCYGHSPIPVRAFGSRLRRTVSGAFSIIWPSLSRKRHSRRFVVNLRKYLKNRGLSKSRQDRSQARTAITRRIRRGSTSHSMTSPDPFDDVAEGSVEVNEGSFEVNDRSAVRCQAFVFRLFDARIR